MTYSLVSLVVIFDLPHTFIGVISLVKKSMLFARTFFDVISTVEKYTLFVRIFFYVISMVEKYPFFPRTFLGRDMRIFLLTFFDVILMG